MKINGEKYIFYSKKVEFLGYILTLRGIRMDLKKIAVIVEWLILKNVTEVQELIEFINFYRKFIKGFSGIATPLTNLIKKETSFV
jgi:hypothetical protein